MYGSNPPNKYLISPKYLKSDLNRVNPPASELSMRVYWNITQKNSTLLFKFLKSYCVLFYAFIQARIAQLEAYRFGAGEVPGLNPGKG